MNPGPGRSVALPWLTLAAVLVGCSRAPYPSEVARESAEVPQPAANTPVSEAASAPPPAPAPEAPARTFKGGPERRAGVAGSFYPGDRDALAALVGEYLDDADVVELPGPLLAIIAPHAGYRFSGPVAGWAFKQLERADVKTAVVVGGHSTNALHAGVYPAGAWVTPLGSVPVDDALAERLCAAGTMLWADTAMHRMRDHALEVMIPFIQVVKPSLPIVPVYFNTERPETAAEVGRALAKAMAGRDAVIVCSTDLSHYPDAATAEKADRETLEAIASLDSDRLVATNRHLLAAHARSGLSCTVCGMGGVLATIHATRRLGAAGAKILRYDHSGNRPRGERDRVVGYGAVAIYGGARMNDGEPAAEEKHEEPKGDPERMLTDDERLQLLKLARASVATALDGKGAPRIDPVPEVFAQPAAAFVTIHKRGRLRGCIGTFDRSKPLWEVVVQFARHAAFRDSRFKAITKDELPDLEFEISVLSPLRKLENPLDLRLGTDGVWIVGSQGERGTFLPQVATETGWSKEQFLSNCASHKAGLPADAWRNPERATVYAYTAEVFSEGEH